MHSGPARLLLIVVLGAAPSSARCEDDTQACRSGRGDDRIAACTRLIGNAGASPTDRASAWENRAKAYASDSRYADVVADLDRAIELEPTIPRYRERALRLLLHRQYAKAIADFDRVVTSDPADDFVLTFRAKTYLKMGDADRAIADFGQAIAVAPGKPDAYVDARGNPSADQSLREGASRSRQGHSAGTHPCEHIFGQGGSAPQAGQS